MNQKFTVYIYTAINIYFSFFSISTTCLICGSLEVDRFCALAMSKGVSPLKKFI